MTGTLSLGVIYGSGTQTALASVNSLNSTNNYKLLPKSNNNNTRHQEKTLKLPFLLTQASGGGSCSAISSAATPQGDAISWTDGNYKIFTIGNNTNSLGFQESGFEQEAYSRGKSLVSLNGSNDYNFTGATGSGSATSSVGTFSNGTLTFATSYTTTNLAEFRTTTTDSFISGSVGHGVYIFPEQGGIANDSYTVSIDFTTPVTAFSLDLVDIFDTLTDNNPISSYEVYADGELIAYFQNPFLGDDAVGGINLYDGSNTLRGTPIAGQNIENTIGFVTDTPVSNVSIRHVINSGSILASARDPHGIDRFTYSTDLPCDYSDAPEDGQSAPNGGTTGYGDATHIIVNGIKLGLNIDNEITAQNSANADGDDNDSDGDDDDGVQLSSATLQAQSLTAGDTITLDLATSGSGVLNAWIDWNGNGNFTDAGEQIAVNAAESGTGDSNTGTAGIQLSVTVPSGATVGNTYARFRYSSDTGLTPTGTASDGEVEDYQIAIAAPLGPADYGDAPDTYGTDNTAGNSSNSSDPVGASHEVVSGIHLGSNVPDLETDGNAPFDGTGDGTDEDGIASFNPLFANNNVYSISSNNITVTNTGNTPATLHGWIDFDGNGIFDPDEHASLTVPALTSTSNLANDLEWNGAGVSGMIPGVTYARFRLTTDTNITASTPGGSASDGEVEDYAITIQSPGTGNGGVCSADYGLIYSGQAGAIYAVHVESGAAIPLTTNALATANGLATDHLGRLVYYSDNNTVYAWDPLTDQHIIIDSNFTSYLTSPPVGFDLGSGGAAYYDGSLYQGVDTGTFEIYKVDFVPGSDGRTVQSITPVGITSTILNEFNSNWGDFIISDDGVILAQSGGVPGVSPRYWTYDLNDGTFTGITAGAGTPNINFQVAKDGQGRLWGLVTDLTIIQLQLVGNTFQAIGTAKSVAPHESYDGAECVRGSSSIGDRIWEDINGDGIQDAGENDLENVTVDLIWDLDGNGTIDTDEPVLATRTTNSNGYYSFNELIFGDYIIQVTDTNNVLTDKILTTVTENYAVTLPTAPETFELADFGYQPNASEPSVLLTKRITAINNNQTKNPNDDTPLDGILNDGIADSADDHANWPNNYLLGAINGGIVKPGDEIEYTINFLSTGDVEAKNVLVCDLVPENMEFVPNGFNTQTPATGGFSSTGRGILWEYNGAIESLTNADDGDSGYYFPPGDEPTTVFPNVKCGDPAQSNTNGAVVVDLGNLPGATSPGTPTNSYGFIRFRARVK